MFDIGSAELLLVAVIALLVIGPKDLPKAMRVVGHWVGKARGVARQLRIGMDDIVRETEMAELEKKWTEENERIMREFPQQEASVDSAADTEGEGLMKPLGPAAKPADGAAKPKAQEPLLPGMDERKPPQQ